MLVLFLGLHAARAQDTVIRSVPDSITVIADTMIGSKPTSSAKSAINSKVDYKASDSIAFDIKKQIVHLYKDAEIAYEDIGLKSAYLEIDFKKSLAFAKGVNDTTGKEIGTPVFKQGDQSYRSKELHYNYKTKKGLINHVITKQDDGYLHGTTVKKMANGEMDVKQGKYTTCSLDDPHFELKFSKAKVIPGNKIVTGPAYIVIENVPLPIGLPFGMFPNKKGRSSGIMIPTYGESATRGFYLENGGYYWGINDHMDLKMTGDIYSHGSWALKPNFDYKVRYKYSGSLNLNYAINIDGQKGVPGYVKSRDFKINWSHRQDPKANPVSNFSASVNAGSSKYDRYNPTTVNDHLSNSYSSSINYALNFDPRYPISISAHHSQNTTDRSINITLPELSFSVARFYPFRRKTSLGQLKWYENVSVTYNMNAQNTISTFDSLLFKPEALKKFKNGMKHSIPVSSSIKLLKYFTMTNSINFTERWYTQYINKTWISDTIFGADTIAPHVRTDTINGFKTAHEYSFSSSVSTTIYGMVQFKNGPVRALRHVLRPTIGFSLHPDFGREGLGYYKTVQTNNEGGSQKYSIFNDGAFTSIYGAPGNGKSGALNFGLNNNLEMKVRSLKDTITGTKKIKLIDNFNISTSYDLVKDSLKWSPVSMSGNTTLFKNIQIQYSSLWNLYAVDSKGKTINRFEWEVHHYLARIENTSWNLGLNWSLPTKTKKKKAIDPSKGTPEEVDEVLNEPDKFIDWNNPWSLSFNYNLRYTGSFGPLTSSRSKTIVQTLGFNGDISVTPKWKVSVRSGYDFEIHKLSYTSMSVNRDLHCWEMRFNWIPMGYLKSWNFQINVKSALLQDLKLKKKKDFRDN
jgi:hypothetical protein